eukprot:11204594-Lingulodinium_polyedra.AAC.1
MAARHEHVAPRPAFYVDDLNGGAPGPHGLAHAGLACEDRDGNPQTCPNFSREPLGARNRGGNASLA